mgnify:CR=1 FL=1
MAEEIEQTEAEAQYTDPDELERDEAELVRWKRDDLLSKCDWWAVSDHTMSQAQSEYRIALRNIPQQEGFPFSITWPTKP